GARRRHGRRGGEGGRERASRRGPQGRRRPRGRHRGERQPHDQRGRGGRLRAGRLREGRLASPRTRGLKIRRARRADFDALLEIEAEAFRTDRLTRRKLVHLTTRGNASLLVGETRGRIVGYALVLFRRGTRSARLYGLAVAASERGRGLGARFLAAAEDE